MKVVAYRSVYNYLGGRRVVHFTDGKSVWQARLIAAIKIGRELRADEQAHHINGDKTDDRLENIAILTRREHARVHRQACAGCGIAIDERTVGCRQCQNRHKMRARRGHHDYVPRVQPGCAECGGPWSERTPGCSRCKARPYQRQWAVEARRRAKKASA